MENKNNILVSIIIPVYNVEKYLQEGIESVINQTYRNIEIILVDDGSTDRSGIICDEYEKKDSRIKVIHQDNRGVGEARNRALDIINGEAVSFMDPDDAYCKSFVQEMVSALINKNADIVVCKHAICENDGLLPDENWKLIMPSLKGGTYDRIRILKTLVDGRLNFGVCNKMFRRDLWKTIRFHNVRIGEDMDVIYRIADLCKIIFVIDSVLYKYRIRPGSAMNLPVPAKIHDKILTQCRFDAFLSRNIPQVINEEKMSVRRQARLLERIRDYIDCYGKKGSEWVSLKKKIKRHIIITAKNIEITNYRIRFIYKMMLSCPLLLKILFSLYYDLKEFVWKNIEGIKNHNGK